MQFFSTLRFRISFYMSLAAILGVIVAGVVGERLSSSFIRKAADDRALAIVDEVKTLARLQIEAKRYSVEIIARTAENQFALDPRGRQRLEVENQLTHEKAMVDIAPMVRQGVTCLEETVWVDERSRELGTAVTIFQLIPQGMLRVATSVRKADGSRAVKTFIPSTSPVYSNIIQGRPYFGRAFVVTDWYFTGYTPLHDRERNLIGALFVGVPEKEVAGGIRETILAKRNGDQGFIQIFDGKGKQVIHPRAELEGTVRDTAHHKRMLAEKKGVFEAPGEPMAGRPSGASMVYSFDDLPAADWIICAAAEESEFMVWLWKLRRVLFFASLGLVLFIAAVSLILATRISQPVLRVGEALQGIAEGDGDLTRQIPRQKTHELALVARHFNAFVAKLEGLVGLTRSRVEESGASSRAISENAGRAMQVVEDLGDRVATARNATHEQNVQAASVEKLSEGQAEQIDKLLTNIRSVMGGIETLSKIVNEQSSAVTEMGATIEEQAANIRSIAQVAGRADASGQSLARISAEGKDLLSRTAHAMQKLMETTRSVNDFASVISGVAGQTNLLAMNAAIEAAHAGEAGRGFAVVADEIRKLADQSNAEALKVKGLLREVETVSSGADQELEKTAQAFDRVVTESRTVSEVVRQVNNAMEEQNTANGEMVKAIADIMEHTETIRSTGDGILSANHTMNEATTLLVDKTTQVRSSLAQLRSLASSIATTMDAVESGLESMRGGTKQVDTLARNQVHQFEDLRQLMARFRIEDQAPALPAPGKTEGVSGDEIRGLTAV